MPRDFLDLGSRGAVDQALKRLVANGDIRRLGRGVYDYPRRSRLRGALSPSVDLVAGAAARSTQTIVQVSGVRAANALGLSQQVPARPTYLTDGPSRTIQVGLYSIAFRRTAPRNLLAAGTRAGTIFQALRYLGKDGVDAAVVAKLRATLDSSTKADLVAHRVAMPIWMGPIIDNLTESK